MPCLWLAQRDRKNGPLRANQRAPWKHRNCLHKSAHNVFTCTPDLIHSHDCLRSKQPPWEEQCQTFAALSLCTRHAPIFLHRLALEILRTLLSRYNNISFWDKKTQSEKNLGSWWMVSNNAGSRAGVLQARTHPTTPESCPLIQYMLDLSSLISRIPL